MSLNLLRELQDWYSVEKMIGVFLAWALSFMASAQTGSKVVDIPTRPGVTQRMLVLTPVAPRAAVVLLAGGHGGLQIDDGGTLKWGAGNFLVRSRHLIAEQGMTVAVVDAPSDRQSPPYLDFFRQTAKHAADLKAVIAWLRETTVGCGYRCWWCITSKTAAPPACFRICRR